MKQLVCEMCGGTDLIKQDGVFACQTCGTKYSVEEARKMMVEGTVEITGTVKVDNSAAIDNYLKMAKNALEANNHEEAENYANKIIELEPQNSPAWEIKGEAAGWQSKLNNNRIQEALVAWLNAIEFASQEVKEEVRENISGKYFVLWAAMVKLRTDNFSSLPSESNANAIISDVNNGIEMMNTLTNKGGVAFNRAFIYETVAKHLNSGAVEGFGSAKKEFGTEHSQMTKWAWERFTASCGNCVDVLNRASEIVRSDALGKTIYENMITISETARDSCSWTFDANSWNSDHYVKDYSFTDEAKHSRNKSISNYRESKSLFLTNQAKTVIDSLQGGRKKAELDLGRKQYWENHQSEKENLENEKQQIINKVSSIDSDISNLSVMKSIDEEKIKQEDIDNKISSFSSQIKSLGLFKGKEKKALQAQISELEVQKKDIVSTIAQLEKEARDIVKPYEDEKTSANNRLSEIEEEFSKDRGQISVKGQYSIENAIVDGKFTITTSQLYEHLKKILPAPYAVETLEEKEESFYGNQAISYHFNIIDTSISDNNKNTGVGVYVEAQGKDSIIKSILVQGGSSRSSLAGKRFAIIGSVVLLSISSEITQSEAEMIMCNIKYSDKLSLFNEGGLSAEFVSHTKNVLGILTIDYSCALIKANK